MAGPLVLFSLGANYLVPVRITEFSVTEEVFDPKLNPILARVSFGFRVLSVTDVPFNSKAGSLFMNYQQSKERQAGRHSGATLSSMGRGGLG